MCANVPGQLAIQTALGGHQSINDLVSPTGRLFKQRELAYEMISSIPGVTCVKPAAAMYLFFRLDPKVYPIKDDQDFVLDVLKKKKVLMVQGRVLIGMTKHIRMVFLPNVDELKIAIDRFSEYLTDYRK